MVILSEFFFVCVEPTAVVDLNPAFILPIFRTEHLGGIFTLLQKKKIEVKKKCRMRPFTMSCNIFGRSSNPILLLFI